MNKKTLDFKQGALLRQYCETHNIKSDDLAELLGVAYNYVYGLFKKNELTVTNLHLICSAYSIPYEYFFKNVIAENKAYAIADTQHSELQDKEASLKTPLQMCQEKVEALTQNINDLKDVIINKTMEEFKKNNH